MERRFYVGTSGYAYKFWGDEIVPTPIRESVKTFYGNTRNKLSTYVSKIGEPTDSYMPSVEINCTRYRKLTPAMCKKWAKDTPDYFKFTVKAPTWITHGKKLIDFEEWWNDDFYPCLEALGDKLVSVLFQFPPRFKYTSKNLEKLQTAVDVIQEKWFFSTFGTSREATRTTPKTNLGWSKAKP